MIQMLDDTVFRRFFLLHLSAVFVPAAGAALAGPGESDGADDERDEAEDESESGDSHGAVDLVLGILVPRARVLLHALHLHS